MPLSINNDPPLPTTSWTFFEENTIRQEALMRELRIHPVIARILVNRSIDNPDDAKRYLSPSLSDLHNPFLMKDMQKGVERLIRALRNHEKIVIYGDYDADGVTSVAILYKFLTNLKAAVSYRIPDRFTEGYSLNRAAIEEIKASGTSLILTVDCGVSDVEHIDFANSLGLDTIVLDHHEVPDTLPMAHAVINTNRNDCPFPFKELAGVGIVFNFLIALRGELRKEGFWRDQTYPNLKEYLDLVALGTIGDISPIVGENRIFTKVGLDLINEGKNLGLNALKEVAGSNHQGIDTNLAAFSLIPRINAAGRVASADDALQLLLSTDPHEARRLARRLDEHNRDRQSKERKILEEITGTIESNQLLEQYRCLVFASDNWHPGVIGIVASRIVDTYYRPTILISLKDDIGKGSGRSISEFNLHHGLSLCHPLLLAYGGHQYAAGLSIRKENIDALRQQLNEIALQNISERVLMPKTVIDADCRLADISHDLVNQLKLLEPFGSGNPEPILCSRKVRVDTSSVVGRNHLSMRLSEDGSIRQSIWFNKGHLNSHVTDSHFSVAFTPQFNHWNGYTNLQLKVRDMSAVAA